MRRASVPLALATLLVLVSAQVAAAAKPFHDKFTEDVTFSENLCGISPTTGIPVTTHVQVRGNFLAFEDHFVDLSQIRVTWTNADGDWLELFVAGRFFVTEELSGDILTVAFTASGIQERIRSTEGLTAAFDRGRISVRQVIDLNDPENFEDDVLVSFEVLFVAGPHPELDSDFTLFCEVVTDVLG
jgi:hypothetical protein